MSDQRITQLPALPKAGVAATDVLPIADVSASQTKKVTAKDLVDAGLDLIDASSIDIDKLDQASVTKLGTTALADDAVTAAKLAHDSSIAVQTTAPSTDNFEGRGYFNSTSGNLQVFNGSAYQQVIVPTAGIGDLQVSTGKLADGAVTTAKVTALGTTAYADSSVTTAKIADGAVTAAKIAADSITATQVAPNAIGASELADSAVDTAAIVNLAVTAAKLSDGAVTTAKLGDLAVTDAKIAAATISYGKLNLADGSIPGAKIATDSIAAGQIAANAVGTSELANASVTTAKVADLAITGAKIANDSITATQIAPSAVGASELADNSVDTAALVDANVTEAKIAGGAVTTTKLGDFAVTDAKIADATITYGKLSLADGSIPGSKLAADAIGAGQIAANAINTSELANNAVTTAKLADGAVTAAKIATDSVTNAQIAPSAVGASELADDAVDTAAVVDLAVTAAKLADGAVTTAKLDDLAVTDAKIANATISYSKLNLADGSIPGAKIAGDFVPTITLADGSVTTANLAEGAVTATKIAADAITNAQIAPSAVGASELADDAVDTAAIVDLAVTAAKLGDGAVVEAKLGDLAVTNAKIANTTIAYGKLNLVDGSVPGAKIAADSITAAQIAAGAVDTLELVDASVTTAKIADGAVTAAKIATDSITATQMAPGAIGASELANNAVDTAAIVDANVTEAKLAGGAVTTNKLGDLAVTDAKIAATTITYGKLNLADGAVPASKLTDATVTGAKLAANAVGTAAVADAAVTTAKVADGAITTAKLTDGAITTAKVDVAGLSADAIAADAITTDKVLDGAITGAKMADDSATIVQAGVPTGSGDFEGQQYFDTNTSVQYVWDSTAWIRQAAINAINFTDNTPIAFAITYPDNHTADVTTSLDTQTANTAFVGPAAGADAAPTFRALIPDDLPDATASTKGIIQPGTGLSVNGGTLNHANSVATGTYTKLTVDAEGHISAGALLEAADIPDIDAAKITTGGLVTDRLADGAVTIDKLADYSTASLGETFPIPSFIGQIHLNPLDKSFYMWDGNVWVPIGISAGQIIFAGTFDASDPVGIGKIASVTPEGAAAGFTVNSAVPASAPGNNKHYFVVSEGGTITSGNAPNVTLAPPDLILSVYNTSSPGWVEVDVSASAGSIAASQISFAPAGQIAAATVQLAIEEVSTECRNAGNITSGTLAVARGGTNLASYTKGDVIAASGATTLVKLPVGTNGQVLTADSTETSGLKYTTPTVGTVTDVTSNTAALTVATSTTTPALTVRSATTSVNGIVQLSDSTSTTSSTLAATPTAVKAAYDLANAALPKAGGVITGALEIGNTGSLVFEGSTNDGNETTITVADPTADRTITFPNVTGNVVTTGDSGTVTSAMIAATTITNAEISASAAIALSKLATGALPTGITVSSGNIVDGTITNADINASAAIVDTKLATISTAGKVSNSATTATNTNTASAIVARDASGNFTAGTITAALTGAASSNVLKAGDTMTGALVVPRASASTPSLTFTGDLSTGIFSPGADQVSISTNGVSRLQVGGNICGVGAADAATAGLEVGPGATGNRIAYLDLIGDTTYADHGLRLIRAGDGANSSGSLINRGTGELKLVSQEAGAITFLTTNAERARIDSAGRLLVGTSTSVNDTFGASRLQVSGTDGNIASMGRYSADAFAPIIYLRKSRGSLGAQGIVSSGDNLGALIWTGSDGAGFIQGAVIAAQVDGTPGANDMPGRLVFSTTSDGAASPTERMRIDSQGRVGVGTASPVVRFQVSESSAGEVEVARFRIEGQTNNPMLRVFADEADNTVTLDTSGSTVGTELVFKEGGAEAMRIDRSGRLLVGPAGSSIATAGIAGGLQLHNTANANGAQFSIVRFNNDTGAGTLILGKSKSATVSPGTAVVGNDSLGNIIFIGDDGTDLGSSGASITAFVDGTPGADDMPGRLVFSTTADGAASPTERMRITSAGNVGIGTTSPSTALQVNGTVTATTFSGALNGNASTVTTNANLTGDITSVGNATSIASGVIVNADINASAAIADTKLATISTAGKVSGSAITSGDIDTSGDLEITNLAPNLRLTESDGTATHSQTTLIRSNDQFLLQTRDSAGTTVSSDYAIPANASGATDHIWRIQNTEAMRIDSSGNVGIGTTSPDAPLHVAGLTRLNSTDTPATSTTSAIARTQAGNNDGNVSLESVATSTNTRHHISFVNPNGIVGSISTNGSATAYNTSSDYRLKENIVPLTGAIDRLQQIPVHRFNFIADPDTVVDGFIAHEAAAVVPECVTGEKDQVDENGKPIYQGIDQSKIVPLLTAALQEALQKIEDLEARLTAANL